MVDIVCRFANSYISFYIFDWRNRSVFRVPRLKSPDKSGSTLRFDLNSLNSLGECGLLVTASLQVKPSLCTMHYALCLMLYAQS